jgi:hypothetical protein
MRKRTCTICRVEKSLLDFYKSSTHSFGRSYLCKECGREYHRKRYAANPERHKRATRKYLKNNPDSRLNTLLKSVYGITLCQYNALLKLQKNKCAICGVDSTKLRRRLDVDHDHNTGTIRGLLCNRCNQAIGLLGENKKNLTNALRYMEKACS